MCSRFKLFLLCFLLSLPWITFADEEPPKVGNFILVGSQQPGSLIAFGQNVVEKNSKKFFIFLDDYIGVNQHYIDFYPGYIYGITDDLSILISTPVTLDYQSGCNRSRGFEDSVIQLEYAFYNKSTKCYVDQASVIANVTFPTGSIQKNPYTGFGAPSYFLGLQFIRTYPDWFYFTSDGGVFPTSKNGNRIGNNYIYEFGIGKNILNINGWVLAWVAELDGFFYQRNRFDGEIDPDSGGNVIYLMPSFWASNNDVILQLGTGYAAIQNFFGDQSRMNYFLAASIRWDIT